MAERREDGRRRTGKRMLRPGLEEASATATEWLRTETSGGGWFRQQRRPDGHWLRDHDDDNGGLGGEGRGHGHRPSHAVPFETVGP